MPTQWEEYLESSILKPVSPLKTSLLGGLDYQHPRRGREIQLP